MTQHNGANGHQSHQLVHGEADVHLPCKASEETSSDKKNQSSSNSDILHELSPENVIPVVTKGSTRAENIERGPSYVPVSVDLPVLESTSTSSTPSGSQDISSHASAQKQDEHLAIHSNSSGSETNKVEENVAPVPAIPPHKNSPTETETIADTENVNLSECNEVPSSVTAMSSGQAASSIENGAVPKAKAGKPRSRNRHKR